MSSVLQQHTAGELVFSKRNLVAATESTTLSEALRMLYQHNVLSLPVLDAHNSVVGVVSITDIMAYVVFGTFGFESAEPNHLSVSATSMLPVSDLLGAHEEGKSVWVFEPTELLENVVEAMYKGVHRVLVRQPSETDRRSEFRVLSQSDVVQFLARHMDQLSKQSSPAVNSSLEVLGLWRADLAVVSISSSATALDAFRRMEVLSVSSLAIVDENGHLVSQISPSDLRGLAPRDFKSLLLPVLDFLRSRYGRVTHPLTCSRSDSLSHAIYAVVAARVHRIWVVDASQTPIGIVSLTDILQQFWTVK